MQFVITSLCSINILVCFIYNKHFDEKMKVIHPMKEVIVSLAWQSKYPDPTIPKVKAAQ